MSQEGAQPEVGLPPGQVASLTVVRGPDAGARVELSGERTVIGRRQGDLVLTDREVSSVHAAVEVSNGGFVLKDLGSTNGTYLDGKKVSSRPLSSGSHLKCGASYLLFEVAGTVAEPEPVPVMAAEPLIAASTGGEGEAGAEFGLGPPPVGFAVDTPPPLAAPLIPPGGGPPPRMEPAPQPVPAAAFPAPSPALPEEVPTGIAPPSSVPQTVIPPASMPIPPAGAAPVSPVGPPSLPGPASSPPPEAQPEPAPEAVVPPARVGVTSHGANRATSPGTPWDALSLPVEGVPIAPSPGASPHVATPLPGSLQLPPSLPMDAPVGEPAEAPTPVAMDDPPPAPALPAGVEASPHDLYLVVEAGADLGKIFPITRRRRPLAVACAIGRSESTA